MPSPEQSLSYGHSSTYTDDLIHRFDNTQPTDVAQELAALRKEIAELRSMLSPPSAIILTGPEVARYSPSRQDLSFIRYQET